MRGVELAASARSKETEIDLSVPIAVAVSLVPQQTLDSARGQGRSPTIAES